MAAGLKLCRLSVTLMMVACLLRTTVSGPWWVDREPEEPSRPAPGAGSALGLDRTVRCSVTLTMVACLFSVNCLEVGSIGWSEAGRGGDGDWLHRVEPGKLAERLTFLEEMVMEEKPALFWGMSVATAELV